MFKRALKKSVWEKEGYFISARKAILTGFPKNRGLKRLKEYSLETSKVLDCGCGGGTVIETIWNKKANFFGVDLSARAIAEGEKRLKEKKNISLKRGDIERLDFPNEHFDLVYTAYTLEHLENPEEVRPFFRRLRELARTIESRNLPNVSMRELSMGMSHDFEVAIEEGATIVRVGTAIFGGR